MQPQPVPARSDHRVRPGVREGHGLRETGIRNRLCFYSLQRNQPCITPLAGSAGSVRIAPDSVREAYVPDRRALHDHAARAGTGVAGIAPIVRRYTVVGTAYTATVTAILAVQSTALARAAATTAVTARDTARGTSNSVRLDTTAHVESLP